MQNVNWVDNLKYRISYGVTGTDAITSYLFGNYFSLGSNYDHNVGILHTNLPNHDLGWESNYQLSTAIEFKLFKTLTGTIEVYNKNTKNLLLKVPIPVTTGFKTIMRNVGEINNKGIEFTLKNKNIDNNDFTWETSFTASFNKNKITKLPDGKPINSGSKRYEEGKSLFDYYMREWVGVNPANGAAQWYKDVKDSKGNITGKEITENYTEATKYFVGRSVADVFGSLKNDFTYKGFGLSVNLYYSLGGKIYDGVYASAMHDGRGSLEQLSTDALNAWKKPGDKTDIPIYIYENTTQSSSMSTRWLVDGSFLKVKNITLSYTLAERTCKKLNLTYVKVFATVDNLHTFTKYKSGDPEQRLSGRSFGYHFHNVRTFRLGIKVKL
jgi:hypothetical protein